MNKKTAHMVTVGVLACFSLAPRTRGQTEAEPPLIKGSQRVVIVMFDGLGPDYVEQSSMPVLKGLSAKGFTKTVAGVMPSVTNVNNASIATGIVAKPTTELPAVLGADERKGQAEYMENSAYLLRSTLFERAAKRGVKSALLTAKKKTVALLAKGTALAIAAEAPTAEQIQKYGTPPPVYSREINYWLWDVAADLLKNRPDLGCLYVHTTDYPMHTWPASALESKDHLARLDSLLGRAVAAAPDAAFLITGDHGMKTPSRVVGISAAGLQGHRGLELVAGSPPSRDKRPCQAPPHLRRHGLRMASLAPRRRGRDENSSRARGVERGPSLPEPRLRIAFI